MTGGGAAATAAALTATLGLAAASWVVAVRQMNGMDMGVATRLGSFAFFIAVWVSMMAAMMLPGAFPAVLRRARASGRVRAVPLFVGSYLAVWTVWASPCMPSTGRTGLSPPARLRSR
jgi:predicted metal-binding membrane protein